MTLDSLQSMQSQATSTMEVMDRLVGAQNEIGDERIQGQIGKLLVSEEDEDVKPSGDVVTKLLEQLGGIGFISFYFLINCIRRYQWIQHGYNFGKLADTKEGDD